MKSLFSFVSLPSRIGRLRFIVYTLAYFIAYIVVSITVLWALINLVNSRPDWTLGHWPIILLFIVYLLGLIPHQLPARRRLADCSLSPNWSLLLFFPVLNVPIVSILLFKAGAPNHNQFGSVPPPNTGFLYFCTVILLLVTAITFLCAVYLVRLFLAS